MVEAIEYRLRCWRRLSTVSFTHLSKTTVRRALASGQLPGRAKEAVVEAGGRVHLKRGAVCGAVEGVYGTISGAGQGRGGARGTVVARAAGRPAAGARGAVVAARALQAGIPYQTLISSILHQYVSRSRLHPLE